MATVGTGLEWSPKISAAAMLMPPMSIATIATAASNLRIVCIGGLRCLVENVADGAEDAADRLPGAFGSRGRSCRGTRCDARFHRRLAPGKGGARKSEQEKPRVLHGSVPWMGF